jgi:hypothetical protein
VVLYSDLKKYHRKLKKNYFQSQDHFIIESKTESEKSEPQAEIVQATYFHIDSSSTGKLDKTIRPLLLSSRLHHS